MKQNSSTKDLNLSSNERLFIHNKSKFAPKNYQNLLPDGLKIYTFHSGLKKASEDLLIIIFDELTNSKSVYSKTSTPSAPIIWDKKYNKGKVKALIVNSGNANAHTGKKGLDIINQYVSFLAKKIKCKKEEILVSSTGVIGELFKPSKIIRQIKKLDNAESKSIISAAKAIMTTDTYVKTSIKQVIIKNIKINVYGIAKGSGMISPNMGTMLGYVFIDLDLSKQNLNKLTNNNIENTFNSISVDSDTSTSDTLVLFSIKKNKIKNIDIHSLKKINHTIFEVMRDLSLKIVKDGEGISKLIIVSIKNSKTKLQAKKIAMSIVNSPLVKTAVAGEDANWGRIIMAIGKTQEKINQNKISVSLGKNLLCKNGSASNKINNQKLNKYMKNKIIEININLHNGNKSHTVYGNDLTYEYVRINADYRS